MDETLKQTIVDALMPYGVKRIGQFGSGTRGDFRSDSDLDVLVEFSGGVSFFELVQLEDELSMLLGCKVDLLTEGSISPYLIESIRKELVVLY